ncbi:hypothetical protein PR048_006929 [Dryococelus australis]|uniref:Uncharacterized protein n=1 Tax=Dryococelus australis TaxID=614101 RepID=A0ABQ9IDM5_9NEOP|nr:hypothetical protein PR048_006929 [Dryococelus australis]
MQSRGGKVGRLLVFHKANRVRFPDFCLWEFSRTLPLVGGFSRESPVSPGPFIPALFHPHLASPISVLKTSVHLCMQLQWTMWAPSITVLWRVCETIRNFPGIEQCIQVSIQRRVDACVRADGGLKLAPRPLPRQAGVSLDLEDEWWLGLFPTLPEFPHNQPGQDALLWCSVEGLEILVERGREHSGDAALDARASVVLSLRSLLCHVASGRGREHSGDAALDARASVALSLRSLLCHAASGRGRKHSGDAALDARASVVLSLRSLLCHVASGALNNEDLADEGETRGEWSSSRMQGRRNGRSPRKSADKRGIVEIIPTCENPGETRPGDLTRFSLMGGEHSNRSATAAPPLFQDVEKKQPPPHLGHDEGMWRSSGWVLNPLPRVENLPGSSAIGGT